jgi:hypothetical protein
MTWKYTPITQLVKRIAHTTFAHAKTRRNGIANKRLTLASRLPEFGATNAT